MGSAHVTKQVMAEVEVIES